MGSHFSFIVLLFLSPGGSLSTRGVKGVKFRAGGRVSGRGSSGQVHDVIVVFTLGQLERSRGQINSNQSQIVFGVVEAYRVRGQLGQMPSAKIQGGGENFTCL